MKALQSRKQLLLAESELNRAQLAWDMAEMKAGVDALTDRVQFFASIVSSVVGLVPAMAAFRRGRSVDARAKRSWLQTVLRGAGLIATLWLSFRWQGRNHKEK